MSKSSLKLNINIIPFVAVFAVTTVYVRIPEKPAYADESVTFIGREDDNDKEEKISSLEKFFEDYNSPLKEFSETFVEVAEKHGMDYRLLPAIACIESSCGKRLIPNSHNPFGWGIYGNNAIHFKSFDEAIEVVGKGIKERYIERGLTTPEKMAPVYAPPNSIKWHNSVNFFIMKIESPRMIDNTILFAS